MPSGDSIEEARVHFKVRQISLKCSKKIPSGRALLNFRTCEVRPGKMAFLVNQSGLDRTVLLQNL